MSYGKIDSTRAWLIVLSLPDLTFSLSPSFLYIKKLLAEMPASANKPTERISYFAINVIGYDLPLK